LAYAYRQFSDDGVKLLPLARFIDFEKHLDLLSGRITFDRERAQSLLQTFLQGIGCGGLSGRSCADDAAAIEPQMNVQFEKLANSDPLIGEFLRKALTQALEPEDMLRVTTTSFMDAYNFDVRQLMKSCVHHLLPSGHIIPFSAYNVLYREGHVELPVLSASDCGTGDKLVSLGPLGADKLS
jgi:uncharacterized radical SAM superfamily Fe-S cluster-containing enzyme